MQEAGGEELKNWQEERRRGTWLSEKWSQHSSALKDLKVSGKQVAATQEKYEKAGRVRITDTS